MGAVFGDYNNVKGNDNLVLIETRKGIGRPAFKRGM